MPVGRGRAESTLWDFARRRFEAEKSRNRVRPVRWTGME
jgi:hypothetical protein